MPAVLPITYRATEGGERVDTDQGCSACKGECPCPQACERREEARQHASSAGRLASAWAAITQWGRA